MSRLLVFLKNVLLHTLDDIALVGAYLVLTRIKKYMAQDGWQGEITNASFLLLGQEVFERYLRPVHK